VQPFFYSQLAGALRKWLMDRELHPKFEPDGRAPDTEARSLAVDLSTREDESTLDLTLAEGGFGIYEDLVDTRSLTDLIKKAGGELIHTSRYKALLAARGLPATTLYSFSSIPSYLLDTLDTLDTRREKAQ
jgi:hypothetical protein